MRRLVSKYPAAAALIVVAIYFGYLALPALGSIKAFGNDPDASPGTAPVGDLWSEIFMAVTVIGLVWLFGWLRSARVTSKPSWGGALYALLPLSVIFAMLAVAYSEIAGNAQVLDVLLQSGIFQKVAVMVLFVGIFEEVLFRGILMHGLERKAGPIVALLLSSAIFGAAHFVNWINGQSLASTIEQVIHAGLAGLLYGALALRANSIWPSVVVHAVWDFTVTFHTAVMGGMPQDQLASGEPAGVTVSIIGFLIKYFEPIFGLVILASWYRWHRKQVVPNTGYPDLP